MKPAVLPFLLAALAATCAAAGDLRPNQQRIDAAATKADLDRDGKVGLSEAKKFGLTREIFRKANPRHDGSLDEREFATALEYQFAAAEPGSDGRLDWKKASRAGIRSRKIFEAADPNHDGLDLDEYVAAMTAQAK